MVRSSLERDLVWKEQAPARTTPMWTRKTVIKGRINLWVSDSMQSRGANGFSALADKKSDNVINGQERSQSGCALSTFLFDLDAMLIDSVYRKLLAWQVALERAGRHLSIWRIQPRIKVGSAICDGYERISTRVYSSSLPDKPVASRKLRYDRRAWIYRMA